MKKQISVVGKVEAEVEEEEEEGEGREKHPRAEQEGVCTLWTTPRPSFPRRDRDIAKQQTV